MASTGPVAAHLKRLIAAGRSITGIAVEAGVAQTTVRRILRHRLPEIWQSTADKLLALRDVPDPAALVDSTGTVRRLQALVVMGHSQKTISDEVGCSFTYISMLTHGQRATVTMALEQAVRRAYARLSMTVGTSSYGRARATGYGWHGPLAWDDETIDDPTAQPLTDAVAPAATEGGNVADRWLMGESVILGAKDRKEVLAYLFEWTNDTAAEIADKLEMTPAAAARQWERMKEQAQLEGRRLWRRVYVPRERTLKQNEMEEAA
ncbi:hypothetical protein ACIQVL_48665 [Streptomyces sp. NPDC090499]|uniref:hypothetical protein n=1 Tax=Streptomyces sp. NPDC090499 TaxID=3365965 RepID=UPI003817CC99